MKHTIDLKLEPGDKCIAENYRSKYKPWELGTVIDVSVKFRIKRKPYIAYTVSLLRKSDKGNGLMLFLGGDKIDKTKQ